MVFLNGTAISGANGQSFTATQTGNYTVTYSLLDYTACVSNSLTLNLASLAIDAFNSNSISIFPNPTTGILSISNSNNDIINKIEIIDFLGKTILVKSTNTSQIDISEFSNGIYILKIYSGSAFCQKKIIKN